MADQSEQSSRSAPKGPRSRGVVTLVVLGCAATALALVAVWARTTVLDTDAYIAAVEPLPQDEDFSTALATNVTNLLLADVNLEEQLTSQLPPQLAPLAGSTATAFRGVAVDTATEFITSDQFGEVWERINRSAHPHMIDVVTGDSTVVANTDGRLVLDLTEPIGQVRDRLVAAGFGSLVPPDVGGNTQMVLFNVGQPGLVQFVLDTLNRLYIALPVLAVLLLGAALWLSEERRRTIMQASVGLLIGMAVSVLAGYLGRQWNLDQVSNPVNRAGIAAIWDQLAGSLITAQVVVAVLSAVVVVVIGLRRGETS